MRAAAGPQQYAVDVAAADLSLPLCRAAQESHLAETAATA